MEKYTVKLVNNYAGGKVFNQADFSNLKEAREWAKGKAVGLKYTVEIYNNDKNELYTEYLSK